LAAQKILFKKSFVTSSDMALTVLEQIISSMQDRKFYVLPFVDYSNHSQVHRWQADERLELVFIHRKEALLPHLFVDWLVGPPSHRFTRSQVL
jgi:hypothetical protein